MSARVIPLRPRLRPIQLAGVGDAIAAVALQRHNVDGVRGAGSDGYGRRAGSLPDEAWRESADEVPIVMESNFDGDSFGLNGGEARAWLTGAGSPEQQDALVGRVARLAYGGGSYAAPPTTRAEAAARLQNADRAAAMEQAFYPRRGFRSRAAKGTDSFWGKSIEDEPSGEVWAAFWQLNRDFRRVQAWGGYALGTRAVLPQMREHLNAWREFSHAWKTGFARDFDLHGITHDHERVMDIAHEKGFPDAYRPDGKEQDYTQPTYGERNRVAAPDVEHQSTTAARQQFAADFVDNPGATLWRVINPFSGDGAGVPGGVSLGKLALVAGGVVVLGAAVVLAVRHPTPTLVVASRGGGS